MVNHYALHEHVIKNDQRPEPNHPLQTSPSIAALLSQYWAKRCEERPTAEAIVTRLEKEVKQNPGLG